MNAPSAPRRWLTHMAVALILALFVATLYRLLLFTNRVLATGDILLYFYPYRDYAAAALRAGEIPLWNPYLFLGAPFLANPQAAVLYPLHWPLAWLDVTGQIYWSAALHTWLLGLGGYALLRRWGYGLWAGLTTGIILAGSGFFGGLIGHLNQMNASAWLPWAAAMLPVRHSQPSEENLRIASLRITQEALGQVLMEIAGMALLVALMLLAGHTQSAYISLFALGVWVLVQSFFRQSQPTGDSSVARWRGWLRRVRVWPWALIVYASGVLLGLLLSAAQLLPTLELSRLGLRSGGLDYLDATSFSLKPLKLVWTLLPSYGLVSLEAIFDTPAFSEFVAYVGLIGFGLGLYGAWKGRGIGRRFGLIFTLLGLALALGRWNPFYYLAYELIPGFDLFRTPARWMMLYTLGMAALAGVAMEKVSAALQSGGEKALPRLLPQERRWLLPALLIALLAGELLLASTALPFTHPTAPQAVNELRTGPAHLLTDPVRTALHPAAAGRFLGMSTITYDPGDMDDLRRIYREGEPPQLGQQEFDELIIALKVQELLVPNLPLLWRIPAVDGYDGGVLPLLRYNQLLTLFAPQQVLTSDGRLREQLTAIPPTNLLGLLNVAYVVTDKVRDLWFEDVFYDRQLGARLTAEAPSVLVETPSPFAATHVDVIGYVDGEPDVLAQLQGRELPAATMRVAAIDGGSEELLLTTGGAPGAHLADGALGSTLAASSGATIAYRDVEGGRQEYRARLPLAKLATLQAITMTHAGAPVDVIIQAITLYDAHTGMFLPLLPSDRGRFRLAHSGDVKIYENLDLHPRAYLVGKTLAASGPDAALDLLAATHASTQTAIVEGMTPLNGTTTPGDHARITAYTPARVEIQTQSNAEALLVLSDAYYPGWTASVDGAPTPIHPTNVLFRGVRVPPGAHTVIFEFKPASWRSGVLISGAALALWAGCILAGVVLKLRRPSRSGV